MATKKKAPVKKKTSKKAPAKKAPRKKKTTHSARTSYYVDEKNSLTGLQACHHCGCVESKVEFSAEKFPNTPNSHVTRRRKCKNEACGRTFYTHQRLDYKKFVEDVVSNND